MKLIVKYSFLADILFLEIALDFDKYVFLWQMCFFFNGVVLESSCIWVSTVYLNQRDLIFFTLESVVFGRHVSFRLFHLQESRNLDP